MAKPSIYFDTSIISAFWYDGANVSMLARRLSTRDWWELEREQFTLWTSAFAVAELQAGRFSKQADCVRMAKRLRFLRISTAVRSLMQAIIDRKIVPKNKSADAAHLAIAAVHRIDYLLTWNYAHMANPIVQSQFDKLCDSMSFEAPLLVSPESIPQTRFGQTIRRKR